jgi:hypothetical protein
MTLSPHLKINNEEQKCTNTILLLYSKCYYNLGPDIRHLLFITILLPLLLLLALIDNGASEASTTTTTLETKPFLTLEKPMLGFKISYPSDWNITDNDFVISFMAPQHAAVVTFTITNLTSYSKAKNLTLDQYTSNEINTIKLVEESNKVGNFFKLIESKPHLLSGQPGHEIVFLSGSNVDTSHNYKTLLVWAMVDGKVYQIRYSAPVSEYSNYWPIVIDMIDSFELSQTFEKGKIELANLGDVTIGRAYVFYV